MSQSSKRRYKILVVDDEPMVSESIQIMLKYFGYDIRTVDNGEAAIAFCQTEQFDLIITDYSMPGMKGDELAAKIKREWPGQKILMISAFGSEVLEPDKTAELDGILTKPFSMDELLAAVSRLVEKSS